VARRPGLLRRCLGRRPVHPALRRVPAHRARGLRAGAPVPASRIPRHA
jgi:hypothetical protein